MAIAGYIGNKEQWKLFVDKWKAGLGPQRKWLHMTDLRWKKDSTKKLLERLGPIPESCGLEGVMGGVRYADYEDLVVGTEDEKMMKGYHYCPAILSRSSLNLLKTSVITRGRNENDLN
jgi:hypothetical protein